MKQDNRNYGIDLLRIISMLLVVILHILGHGGLLHSTQSVISFSLVWLMNIIAYPAVNCFVLISGYVGYRENHYFPKLQNIISLYFQVFFYSISLFILSSLIHPEEWGLKSLLYAFMPVTTRQYWFFSCYFILFLFSPMIHCFVTHLNMQWCVTSFWVILFFLSIPTLFFDPIGMNKGFGFIWFTIMYLLGALLKKTNIPSRIPPLKCGLIAIAMLLFTWFLKLSSIWKVITLDGINLSDALIGYSTPTILIASLCIFCLFVNVKPRQLFQKCIRILAPAAFSVYLIHDNLYIRKHIITNRFIFINDSLTLLLPLWISIAAICIFFLCFLIDRVRQGLFQLLHIKAVVTKTESFIRSVIQHLNKFFIYFL